MDGRLTFEVNGERFDVSGIDPSTTLLEFLRSQTRFKSVKLGCGEGGCGACVVHLSKHSSESFTVSSCLTLLCSVNRCSITTSEGIANSKSGFHPIHKRLAGFHASQCGYCTPGMCVSLFSALQNSENKPLPHASPGFSNMTVSETEKAIAGNLCRCTGYRPISDACKSFAADVDLEDLGINSFWKKGHANVTILPTYDPKVHSSENLGDRFSLLNPDKYSWHSPVSIEALQELLQSSVGNGTIFKLVVGNTGNGYYKETEKYEKYIDLRYIPELSVIRRDDSGGIELGAALSISKVISHLKEKSDMVFAKIANHLEKLASGFIRNSASIGGNLVMAQSKFFPSDIVTLLLAVGSSVSILTGHKREKVEMEEFLKRPGFGPSEVLLSVHIPFLETKSMLFFETYRASPRPLGNALPYLNAAFSADVSIDKSGIVVNKVKLAFGAYGINHATRARRTEEYLTGRMLSKRVLDEAIELVKGEVVPREGTSHASYRSSLAVGFLFEFLSSFGDENRITSQVEDFPLLASSKQVVETSKEYHPVGAPMSKSGAEIQASGEAVYVDDIPSPENCLHAAFVCSTKPVARVKGVSLPAEVAGVISVKDIPREGENIGSLSMFGSDPLFVDEVTGFAGDLIAVVVAETQKKADLAAKTALVDYDTEGLDPPILTVEDAVERSSFIDFLPFVKTVGDFSKGMAEADHTILSEEIRLGSQYYFYMETQAALAIPDEDNCMVVYTSSQAPEFSHRVIAKCLGIPDHNVRVLTRRVGGGFGGKVLKAMHVATACALAAHRLNRPVRIYLDRKTDMIRAGGRHPMKITYSVGFRSDGKLTALHVDVLINAGISADVSPMIPRNMIGALKKYNWGSLSFDVKLCKTNVSSKSAMRAPGEVQGTFIAEAVIEHVASVLSLNADLVRNRNLHTYESLKLFYGDEEASEFTLNSVWDKLAQSSRFEQRIKDVELFNSSNVWRKRGISRVPIVHAVNVRGSAGKVSVLWDGSIVVEVGGIELGQGLWTKVRQVAAYALGRIQCDGAENLVEKVRVLQSDSLSLVQGGYTAGSTTSESSCEVVRMCCNVLVERLGSLKEKMKEETGSVKWDDLILQAHYQSLNLAANSYFVPDSGSMTYLNYGAAVSEVEVNILTGETRIRRTDIVYDCGQSMNPAVDLGQIEGAFVQGLGFFMLEEYETNSEGSIVSEGTWDYKIPTIDNIPREFNVEVMNSGHHRNRILSSKASGEPPLLLAASVHCATREAIKEARRQLVLWGVAEGSDSTFQLDVPATMPVVKRLCGLDSVEAYLRILPDRAQ